MLTAPGDLFFETQGQQTAIAYIFRYLRDIVFFCYQDKNRQFGRLARANGPWLDEDRRQTCFDRSLYWIRLTITLLSDRLPASRRA